MSTLPFKFRTTILAFAVIAGGSSLAYAKGYPMVGGAAMYPTKTIVENAANSQDHTTLVAAVKAAGLVETLSGPGPFTVLAPTNAAFAKLPAGTVDTLVMPENKAMLTSILTYHVIPGKISAKMIAGNAMAHKGKATYTTVNGGTVTFMKSGPRLGGDGRQGRHGESHHRRRQPVERCDPRRRYGADAVTGATGLSAQCGRPSVRVSGNRAIAG